MNKLLGAVSVSVLAMVASAAQASTQTVFQTDFTTSTTSAGVTATPVAGGGFVENVGAGIAGFYTGDVFRNTTGGVPTGTTGDLSSWTLSGLGAHDHLTVSFTAAFLDSWDSTDGSPAPDFLNIFLDGVQVLQLTSAGASGTVTTLGGGTQVAFGDLFDSSGGFFSHDRIVDMSTAPSLTFAHTAGTFVLGISASGSGWQGGDDESWGIDNLVVTSSFTPTKGGVPEPASWALMLLGFGVVGAVVRGRRRETSLAA